MIPFILTFSICRQFITQNMEKFKKQTSLLLRKIRDQLCQEEKQEFYHQQRLLRFVCVHKSMTKNCKILSKIVLVLNVILNVFCFYGLINYFIQNPKNILMIYDSVGPSIGTICMLCNCFILIFNNEELFNIIDEIQTLNRKCKF